MCKIITVTKRLVSKSLVISFMNFAFCLFISFHNLINYLQYKITIILTTEKLVLQKESSGGVVVRALASHQCGPGSILRLGVICGLSLLVHFSALRGFPPGTPVFPSCQTPASDSI